MYDADVGVAKQLWIKINVVKNKMIADENSKGLSGARMNG